MLQAIRALLIILSGTKGKVNDKISKQYGGAAIAVNRVLAHGMSFFDLDKPTLIAKPMIAREMTGDMKNSNRDLPRKRQESILNLVPISIVVCC